MTTGQRQAISQPPRRPAANPAPGTSLRTEAAGSDARQHEATQREELLLAERLGASGRESHQPSNLLRDVLPPRIQSQSQRRRRAATTRIRRTVLPAHQRVRIVRRSLQRVAIRAGLSIAPVLTVRTSLPRRTNRALLTLGTNRPDRTSRSSRTDRTGRTRGARTAGLPRRTRRPGRAHRAARARDRHRHLRPRRQVVHGLCRVRSDWGLPRVLYLLAQCPHIARQRRHRGPTEVRLMRHLLARVRLPLDQQQRQQHPAADNEERGHNPQQMPAAIQSALRPRHGVPPSRVTSRRSRATSSSRTSTCCSAFA